MKIEEMVKGNYYTGKFDVRRIIIKFNGKDKRAHMLNTLDKYSKSTYGEDLSWRESTHDEIELLESHIPVHERLSNSINFLP